ncbi:MAG: VWA domain-containing protein [Acholeplasmatales bacterium]|jgi:uncharacterized protein YegL|nr:VWA domain-containing protein [Acholeplasmatales bacterium]
MENKSIELVFILDKSGSMAGSEKSVINGFNSLIEQQKSQKKGNVKVSVVLFDDDMEILINRVDISLVDILTTKQYYVEGSTALLDAIGTTSQKLKQIIDAEDAINKPSKVMIFIYTDGYENASKEYSSNSIKNIIEAQEKEGWEYYFIGAAKEAVTLSRDFGIKESRSTVSQNKDDSAFDSQFNSINKVVSKKRQVIFENYSSIEEELKADSCAEHEWNSEILEDNDRDSTATKTQKTNVHSTKLPKQINKKL